MINTISPFWLAFCAALLLRVPLFLALNPGSGRFLEVDSLGYVALAENLLREGVFSRSPAPPYVPETTRTPGYPSFLAFIGRPLGSVEPKTIVFIQIFLGAVTAAMTAQLTLLAFENRSAAAAAGVLAALDWTTVIHNFLLLTETVFTLLLLCGVYALCRGLKTRATGFFAAAGFLFSLASLARPIGLYLGPSLAVFTWLFFQKKKAAGFAAAAALLACSLILPSAWVLRNRRIAGVWEFSAISRTALYARAAAVNAAQTGGSWKLEFDKFLNDEKTLKSSAWKIIARHPLLHARNVALDIASMFFSQGLSLTGKIWLRDAAAPPERSRRAKMLSLSASGFWEYGLEIKHELNRFPALWICILLYFPFLILLHAGAAVGIWRLRKTRHWPQALLFTAVIAYFTFLSAGAMVSSRFRIPITPYLAALAGIGISLGRKAAHD